MLDIKVKYFKELTTQELYEILQLRSEVFVVEQDCVYQDIDNKDQKALHVLGFKKDKVVAYTRFFKPGDNFKQASIGRVVVCKKERHNKYGNVIMKATIVAIKKHFKENIIVLSAQTYLKAFYNNLNFIETGEEYLEDNIPHIKMIKKH